MGGKGQWQAQRAQEHLGCWRGPQERASAPALVTLLGVGPGLKAQFYWWVEAP